MRAPVDRRGTGPIKRPNRPDAPADDKQANRKDEPRRAEEGRRPERDRSDAGNAVKEAMKKSQDVKSAIKMYKSMGKDPADLLASLDKAESKAERRQVLERAGVEYLQKNFDQYAGEDGMLSRDEIGKMPKGPARDQMMKHYDEVLFGSIDAGDSAWFKMSKADLDNLATKVGEGKRIGEVAGELTVEIAKDRDIKDANGDGALDRKDLKAYVQEERAKIQAEDLKNLSENYDQIAGEDGMISRQELKKLPDGPAKEALLKNYDAVLFGSIDAGDTAWFKMSKGDVDALLKKVEGGQTIDGAAKDITAKVIDDRDIQDMNKDGKTDVRDLKKYVHENRIRIESKAVDYLQKNFDKIAGADGTVSKDDLAKLPDGPGKDALIRQFDRLIFGNIEQGAAAWSNLSKADVKALADGLEDGDRIWATGREHQERIIEERNIGDLTGDGVVDGKDLKQYVEDNRARVE